MPQDIPTFTLNNGVEMPILGFGVFQIPAEETEQAVLAALKLGYRSIDTAAAYQNEEAVGRAIAKSGIPREELFVTTKLWIQDAGEEAAARAFETSMTKLGLDYLDLWLIHQPYGDYYGSWRTMEKLYEQERVRAIGVSNFYPDRLTDLITHNTVVPAVDQLETHPYFQRTADETILREKDVQMEAWGPLAQGQHHLLHDPVLTEIASRSRKSTAQVALRWLTQRGVAGVVKSTKPERMRENLDVFDFQLSDDEMAQIASLDGTSGPGFDHRDAAGVDFINSMDLT